MARQATRQDLNNALNNALRDKHRKIMDKSPWSPPADIFKTKWLAIKALNHSEHTKIYAIPGLSSMDYAITSDGRTAYRGDTSHWYFVADITTKLGHLSDQALGELIFMLGRPNTWKWVS